LAFTTPSENPTRLTFRCLGAGTNKCVYRVVDQPWVLAMSGNNRSVANGSVKEEVETLLRIGTAGLRVPKPFDNESRVDPVRAASEYYFDIDIEDEVDGEPGNGTRAFIQELIAFDVEMPKKIKAEKENYDTNHILHPERKRRPSFDRSLADITGILTYFRVNPWGDFQVLYNRTNGYVYVFDPLKTDPLRDENVRILEKWIADLNGSDAGVVAAPVVASTRPRSASLPAMKFH
jgi:hypothetical protein